MPIRGTPLLAIWLELLEKYGITEALINLHHLHEKVNLFLRSYPSRLRVTTVYEQRLLGSAGTVLENRAFVEGQRDFLVLYADNLTNLNLGRMVRFHRSRGGYLTLGVVPTDRPTEKGVVVVGHDGRVTDFAEKPSQPRSNLANAGVYVATQELFGYLPASLANGETLDFGYQVLPSIVPHLYGYPIHEFLMDVGTPQALESAQKEWPGL